ncbi:uncharacterized protein EV420DRAFT_1482308 [Desarmillaria tabescens]|uniref:Uncharacterized protein n=1 Tax=Armillaria tabescens TaxID=1929756 RepID=A0AA39K1Z7_ARMTA|nr:uncharacterized protein EV420DRAFT_1482308 [Desarmillaria tabescens]KAK0451965.1 hypothetical protein EV420DRAFT_1482308 [Desarmillaria tabescens]
MDYQYKARILIQTLQHHRREIRCFKEKTYPLGSKAHQKRKKKQSNQPSASGPTASKEKDVFSMDNPSPPSPPSPPDTPKLLPVFVFPIDENDPHLQSMVSVNNASHCNSPEFVHYGPRQERQVTCLQLNLGNFKGSVFHHDDLLKNLHPSQLEAISKNLPGSVLAYQSLLENITEDKLAPPYIVIIKLTREIWDVLCQRILALHIVLANCEMLFWAVWLFKANEPIITRSTEKIAKIRNCLHFIILQDM